MKLRSRILQTVAVIALWPLLMLWGAASFAVAATVHLCQSLMGIWRKQ